VTDKRVPEAEKETWRKMFSVQLSSLPQDYVSLASASAAKSHCFREELAKGLQASLNAHVRTFPRETYAEKQAICSWVNAQLRQLGLNIRCPTWN